MDKFSSEQVVPDMIDAVPSEQLKVRLYSCSSYLLNSIILPVVSLYNPHNTDTIEEKIKLVKIFFKLSSIYNY